MNIIENKVATVITTVIAELIQDGWLIIPSASMQSGYLSQTIVSKNDEQYALTIKLINVRANDLINEYAVELRTMENGWIRDLVKTFDSFVTYKDKIILNTVEEAEQLALLRDIRRARRQGLNQFKQFETKCSKQKKGFNGTVLVTRKRNGYQINTQFGKERLVTF